MAFLQQSTYPLSVDNKKKETRLQKDCRQQCTRWHLMLHKMASHATQDGILCIEGR